MSDSWLEHTKRAENQQEMKALHQVEQSDAWLKECVRSVTPERMAQHLDDLRFLDETASAWMLLSENGAAAESCIAFGRICEQISKGGPGMVLALTRAYLSIINQVRDEYLEEQDNDGE